MIDRTKPRRCLDIWPGEGNPRNSEGSFATLRDGRLLFVYSRFNGRSDDDNTSAELMARYSSDGGETWTQEDRLIVKNDSKMNVMSVSLLRLQNGRLALFYVRKNSNYDCLPVIRFSDDEGETWSDARCCVDEPVGYYVLNNDRAIQLVQGPHRGRIILPLARHSLLSDQLDALTLEDAAQAWGSPESHIDGYGQITCALSDDNGLTWRLSKSLFKIFDENGLRVTSQEPGVVELRDSRILLFARSGRGQYFCYSDDGGDTWTQPVLSPLHSRVSPASIKRLPTGDLLAVWVNHDAVPGGHWDFRRTPLATGVSRDEGKTWEHVKLLEGNTDHGHYCYIGIHVMEHDVMLSYCGIKGLQHTRLAKLPIDYLYADGPETLAEITPGGFDELPLGPLTTASALLGQWTTRAGDVDVVATRFGRALHLAGGQPVVLEVQLPRRTAMKDLPMLTRTRLRYCVSEECPGDDSQYDVSIEARQSDGQWQRVFTDIKGEDHWYLCRWTIDWDNPDVVTDCLRISARTAYGVLLADAAQTVKFHAFFPPD